jgi:hypothetical protein
MCSCPYQHIQVDHWKTSRVHQEILGINLKTWNSNFSTTPMHPRLYLILDLTLKGRKEIKGIDTTSHNKAPNTRKKSSKKITSAKGGDAELPDKRPGCHSCAEKEEKEKCVWRVSVQQRDVTSLENCALTCASKHDRLPPKVSCTIGCLYIFISGASSGCQGNYQDC